MPSPRFVFALLALSSAFTLAAHADPIVFTESVTASGDFNGSSFTDELVTITGSGDTSGITHASGLYKLNLSSVTLEIGTDSVVTFTDPLYVFDNQNPTAAAGFSSPVSFADLLDTTGSAFSSYALGSSFSASGSPIFNYQLGFQTTGGEFDLTDVAGNSTFSAAADAPEPSALVLLATGLSFTVALGETRRRKGRQY